MFITHVHCQNVFLLELLLKKAIFLCGVAGDGGVSFSSASEEEQKSYLIVTYKITIFYHLGNIFEKNYNYLSLLFLC